MADATVLGQFVTGGTLMIAIGGLYYQGRAARIKDQEKQDAARQAADDKAEARTKAITESIAANQKTTDDRITAVEHAADIRFRTIEQTLGDHAGQFMPRDQIMGEFRHARQNRETVEAQIMRMHEGLTTQVRDNAIGLARTTEQTALLNSTLSEVKDELKTLTRWLGEKFDNLQSSISGRHV